MEWNTALRYFGELVPNTKQGTTIKASGTEYGNGLVSTRLHIAEYAVPIS